MRGRRHVAVDPAEEQLGCGPAYGAWILGDDGQAGVDQIGKQNVVKPDAFRFVRQATEQSNPTFASRIVYASNARYAARI